MNTNRKYFCPLRFLHPTSMFDKSRQLQFIFPIGQYCSFCCDINEQTKYRSTMIRDKIYEASDGFALGKLIETNRASIISQLYGLSRVKSLYVHSQINIIYPLRKKMLNRKLFQLEDDKKRRSLLSNGFGCARKNKALNLNLVRQRPVKKQSSEARRRRSNHLMN